MSKLGNMGMTPAAKPPTRTVHKKAEKNSLSVRIGSGYGARGKSKDDGLYYDYGTFLPSVARVVQSIQDREYINSDSYKVDELNRINEGFVNIIGQAPYKFNNGNIELNDNLQPVQINSDDDPVAKNIKTVFNRIHDNNGIAAPSFIEKAYNNNTMTKPILDMLGVSDIFGDMERLRIDKTGSLEYDGKKLPLTPEQDYILRGFVNKTTGAYDKDSFAEKVGQIALGAAIDTPLMILTSAITGGIGSGLIAAGEATAIGSAVGKGMVTAGTLLKASKLATTATGRAFAGAAEQAVEFNLMNLPTTINSDDPLKEIGHQALIGLFGSVLHGAGSGAARGITKMSSAELIKSNPALMQEVMGLGATFTFGAGLSKLQGAENTDAIATGLGFALPHFANTQAFRRIAKDNRFQNLLFTDTKGHQGYYETSNGKAYEVNMDILRKTGEIVRIPDLEPVDISIPEVRADFKKVWEAHPPEVTKLADVMSQYDTQVESNKLFRQWEKNLPADYVKDKADDLHYLANAVASATVISKTGLFGKRQKRPTEYSTEITNEIYKLVNEYKVPIKDLITTVEASDRITFDTKGNEYASKIKAIGDKIREQKVREEEINRQKDEVISKIRTEQQLGMREGEMSAVDMFNIPTADKIMITEKELFQKALDEASAPAMTIEDIVPKTEGFIATSPMENIKPVEDKPIIQSEEFKAPEEVEKELNKEIADVLGKKEVTSPIEKEVDKGDYIKVQDLADRIARGETVTTPEDLQLQLNYPKALESKLKEKVVPVKPITAESYNDRPAKLGEEVGKFAITEGGVMSFETADKIREIGNIKDLKESDIKKLGYKVEPIKKQKEYTADLVGNDSIRMNGVDYIIRTDENGNVNGLSPKNKPEQTITNEAMLLKAEIERNKQVAPGDKSIPELDRELAEIAGIEHKVKIAKSDKSDKLEGDINSIGDKVEKMPGEFMSVRKDKPSVKKVEVEKVLHDTVIDNMEKQVQTPLEIANMFMEEAKASENRKIESSKETIYSSIYEGKDGSKSAVINGIVESPIMKQILSGSSSIFDMSKKGVKKYFELINPPIYKYGMESTSKQFREIYDNINWGLNVELPYHINNIMFDKEGWHEGKEFRDLANNYPDQATKLLNSFAVYEKLRGEGRLTTKLTPDEFVAYAKLEPQAEDVYRRYMKSILDTATVFKDRMKRTLLDENFNLAAHFSAKNIEMYLDTKIGKEEKAALIEQFGGIEGVFNLPSFREGFANFVIEQKFGDWGKVHYYNSVRPNSPDTHIIDMVKPPKTAEESPSRIYTYASTKEEANRIAQDYARDGYQVEEIYKIGDLLREGTYTGRMTDEQILHLAQAGGIDYSDATVQSMLEALKLKEGEPGKHQMKKEYVPGMKFDAVEFENQHQRFVSNVLNTAFKSYAFKKSERVLREWQSAIIETQKTGILKNNMTFGYKLNKDGTYNLSTYSHGTKTERKEISLDEIRPIVGENLFNQIKETTSSQWQKIASDVPGIKLDNKQLDRLVNEFTYTMGYFNNAKMSTKAPAMDKIKSFTSAMTMGGFKFGFLAQQSLQVLQGTTNILAAEYAKNKLGSAGTAIKDFGEAVGESARISMILRAKSKELPLDKFGITEKDTRLLNMLEFMQKANVINAVGIDALSGLGGEVDFYYDKAASKYLRGAVEYSNKLNKMVEKWTRVSSAIAFFNAGEKMGLDDAQMQRYLVDNVQKSMGDFSKYGQAPLLAPKTFNPNNNLLTTSLKKSFMTYKTFSFYNFGLWTELIRNRQWGALGVKSAIGLGMHGVKGFPMIAGLTMLAQMWADEDIDKTAIEMSDYLDQLTGTPIGSVLHKGLGTAAGLDLSNTFDESAPIITDMYARTWSKNWQGKLLELSLGAPITYSAEYANNMSELFNRMKDQVTGDKFYTEEENLTKWKHISKLLPVSIRNNFMAFALKENGIDARGKILLKPDEVDLKDVVYKFLSLPLEKQTRAYTELEHGYSAQIGREERRLEGFRKVLQEINADDSIENKDAYKKEVIAKRDEVKQKISELKQQQRREKDAKVNPAAGSGYTW